MQVSTDGVVRYVGIESATKRDTGKVFHFLTVADEKGRTLSFFADERLAGKCSMLAFGTELSLVIDVYSSRGSIGFQIVDFIVAQRNE